jgi:uncharacterized Zn-finger protein
MAHESLIRPTQYGLEETAQRDRAAVEVLASDLQGPGLVFCPNPKMALWSGHPRVFIDLAGGGSGRCPYCGTEYRLKAGERIGGAH